jgi:hypothetical protein
MRPRLVQHLFSAAVVGVCVAGAGPEESDHTDEVSIESAKREFDTLRKVPGISSGSQLRLPDIAGPQLPMADEPSGAMVPSQKASRLKKREKERSENWLLDAMLDQPEDETETDSLQKEQQALRADPFEQMIAEQLSPAKQEEADQADIEKTDQIEDQVVNPLSAFMAGWVSDQDRAMLVPDANQNSGDVKLADSVGSPAITSLSRANSYRDMSSKVRTFDQVEGSVETNPYLDFQTPVFKEPMGREPTQLMPPINTETSDQSPLEPTPTPRTPETASPLINRPDEAEKYFPQLKRF